MMIVKVLPNGPWATNGPKGWETGDGKAVVVSASPKKSKFYNNLDAAKAAGFSPTPAQEALVKSKTEQPKAAPAAVEKK